MNRISIFFLFLAGLLMSACSNDDDIIPEIVNRPDNLTPSYTQNSVTVKGDLTDGMKFEIPHNSVMNKKTLSFTGSIDYWKSEGTLCIGHGRNGYLGNWIEITDTELIVKGYATDAYIVAQKPHHLSLENTIQVYIIQNSNHTASISICSNGETFSLTSSWYGCNGEIWAKGENMSLKDCSFSWYADSILYDTWLFGDSYFSLNDNKRWTTYLFKDGHSKNLLNGHSGEGSVAALQDLKNLLKLGSPRRIVWCMGMNDLDSTTGVNGNWKNCYDELEEICGKYNIELVLSTIPNVIGGWSDDDVNGNNGRFRNHSYKNQIVRNSGYRYIDFEKAVVSDPDKGLWYGTTLEDIRNKTGNGMLGSDGIHPTPQGALTLYYQALADCPELATL